jgi:hypothetical protein
MHWSIAFVFVQHGSSGPVVLTLMENVCFAGVVEILASEVANIAEFFSEPSARSPDLESRVPLAEAKQRMEVYPTILALIARMSLDAPFETSPPT